ncbi:MAG: penicillin-binding transpeptidase domain-containing protein, partial [Planctomycetota bacterium]
MRSVLRQAIPSMFHRRLLLLAAVSCGLMALLAMQTARLTTGAERDERRDILRKHLEQADYTPTSRGRIYDRKGRLLAEDRPGWEIAVSFRVLSGNWAYVKAREAAQRRVGRSAWRDLTLDEQDDLARQYVRPYLVQIEQLRVTLAELGNVPPEEIEARQREIVRWVQTMAANATARKRDHQVKTLKKSSGDSADPELSWAEVYVEVAEEFQSHPVLTDVPPETVTWIDQFIAKAQQERELEPDEPGEYEVWLEVTPRRLRLRRYPWESRTFALDRSTLPGSLRNDAPLEMTVEGIGRHVLGSLRPIHKGDAWWDRRPFVVRDPETGERRVDLSGYRPRDPIGRLGIERSMEATLRGTRGRRVLHLDTGETEVVRPAPGSDVHLSLDIQLQMRLQALMSHDPAVGLMRSQTWHNSGYDADETPHNPRPGDPLNGAAVVLDIDNGEVLAAVSVPGTTLDDLDDPGSPYYRDFDNRVSIFRPVGYRYDPGSTNKPLVLAAAITDGVVGPDEALDCSQGHLWEHAPNIFREWIYRPRYGLQTFGTIDGVEALTVSSNVFFGQLAQRFGESQGYGRVVEWFNRFGFGRRAGVGLLEEIAGDLPPPGARVTEADAAYMAIGEGQLS